MSKTCPLCLPWSRGSFVHFASSLNSYGVSYFLIPHSLWPTPFRGRALLDCEFFFLQSTFLLISTVLLPFLAIPFCHSCCDVIWLQLAGPLRALILLSMTQYGHLGFVLHCLWALLSYLFILGRPWPTCFPWTSLAIFLTLYSHGFLLTLLVFPGPITLSFILGAHGFAINPLLSLFALLRACCGPFSLFYITYCRWVCYFSLSSLSRLL